jgi:CTP:molybdopterin cytidylyltransferase MocA
MTFALIPAAGTSSRMGRPKLALPLGDGTVLGHVIEALRQAEIEHILVVVGPHVPELVPLAEAAGATVLLLAAQTADMRTSVEQGLNWLEARFRPSDNERWLLAPADHPVLQPRIVRQLLRAQEENPHCSIVVPAFQGRRGHPTLLRWKHVAGIRKLPADQGLNTYLREHADATLEVEGNSPSILWDLDTPEDYERLRDGWPYHAASFLRGPGIFAN